MTQRVQVGGEFEQLRASLHLEHPPRRRRRQMFKGILPSKRTSASDFTVLTPLADANPGKENLPWNNQASTTASKGGRAGGLIQTKKKRSASKKRQEEPLDLPETNLAFDKLLVSPDFANTNTRDEHEAFAG
jgi:hypothetical protein